jgi:glycosyltransferase involved in cell wall biosynthesis
VSRHTRICFVLPSLNGGGAERAAVYVLNALSDTRWDRSMYLGRREGAYLADLSTGIRLAAGAGGSRLSQWLQLRRFLAEEQPRIVVAFLSYFSVLSAVRASATAARVVFNQQTPMSAFLEDADYQWRRPNRRRLFTLATRTGFNAADVVVATSNGVADDLAHRFGVRRERMTVIPNPVDLDGVRSRATEALDAADARCWTPLTIVAAGRLADAKNYPLLIEAMALVRERVDARLVILGQGDREASLRRLVSMRGMGQAITFAGFQPNPWKFIARARVFVLTSRYEGFGNVLIEAAACGVPLVATASPGTRDIVRDRVDGFLVEDHSPRAVADALLEVLTDDVVRARLSAQAIQGAERFSLPRVTARYDELFARIAA